MSQLALECLNMFSHQTIYEEIINNNNNIYIKNKYNINKHNKINKGFKQFPFSTSNGKIKFSACLSRRQFSTTLTLNTSEPGKLDTKQVSSNTNKVGPESSPEEKPVFKVPDLPLRVHERLLEQERERIASLQSKTKCINECCSDLEEEVEALEDDFEDDPENKELEKELEEKRRTLDVYNRLNVMGGVDPMCEHPPTVYRYLKGAKNHPDLVEYKDILDKQIKNGAVVPEDTVPPVAPLVKDKIKEAETTASINTFESGKSDTKRKFSESDLEQGSKRQKQEEKEGKSGPEAFSIMESSETKENTVMNKLFIILSQLLGLSADISELLTLNGQLVILFLTVCFIFIVLIVFIPFMLYNKYKQYKNNKSENYNKQHKILKPNIKAKVKQINKIIKRDFHSSTRDITKSFRRLSNNSQNLKKVSLSFFFSGNSIHIKAGSSFIYKETHACAEKNRLNNVNKDKKDLIALNSSDIFNDICFNEWFGGLIDGDGEFIISKKGHASLKIVMSVLDKSALYAIKHKYGGSVKSIAGSNLLRYKLHNKKGLINLIHSINGLIRNPTRLLKLYKICLLYNINLIEPKPLKFNNG